MRVKAAWAIVLALSASSTSVASAKDATACATTDASLPAELAAWPRKTAVAGAASRDGLPRAKIAPGAAYLVGLTPTPAVTYLAEPAKPAAAASYGAMVGIDIAKAGTYVVALDGGAWIDVIKDKTMVASAAHGHGPACSTIRKFVEFPLKPGSYTIQLAGSLGGRLGVMVARRP